MHFRAEILKSEKCGHICHIFQVRCGTLGYASNRLIFLQVICLMGRQVFITIQKINQKLLFFHSTLLCMITKIRMKMPNVFCIPFGVVLTLLVSLRFVTLWATATWIPFKIPLLWLIQQWSPIVFFCHLRCRAVQRDKSQTHYWVLRHVRVHGARSQNLNACDFTDDWVCVSLFGVCRFECRCMLFCLSQIELRKGLTLNSHFCVTQMRKHGLFF